MKAKSERASDPLPPPLIWDGKQGLLLIDFNFASDRFLRLTGRLCFLFAPAKQFFSFSLTHSLTRRSMVSAAQRMFGGYGLAS